MRKTVSSAHALQMRANGGLSDALAQRAQVQYAIVSHYLNDTTGTDSLEIYLAAQPDIWAKQLLLIQYIAEKDTLAADALLQTIQINSLNPSQQAEWNDLAEYYGLCKQITVNENSVPDSLQLIALSEIATHVSTAGSYVRNLLISQGSMEYHEPYIFPDDKLKSGKVLRKKRAINDSNIQLRIFPNPAKDYVIVEYNSMQSIPSPVITITDELGKLIRNVSTTDDSGFQVIVLSDLAPGLYLIRLKAGNKYLKESKLVVIP